MFNFVQVQASGPWGLRPEGEGEDFNHRHTLRISRIALKRHFVQNLSLTQKLGKREHFSKVS
ncbi:MAG: hypothetical protein JSW04_12515, partial [Desulfobacterales bacterium]